MRAVRGGVRPPGEERVNYSNGYRTQRQVTRAATIELAIPRLRQDSHFPWWLLERRRRSEEARTSVVATSYLLGGVHPAGGETGRDAGHQEPVREPAVGAG
jgi:transposase-like protein